MIFDSFQIPCELVQKYFLYFLNFKGIILYCEIQLKLLLMQ